MNQATYHAHRSHNPNSDAKPRHPAFCEPPRRKGAHLKPVNQQPHFLSEPEQVGALRNDGSPVQVCRGRGFCCRDASENMIGTRKLAWCDYYGERLKRARGVETRCDTCMELEGR